MAHNQSDEVGSDPKKFGLKFDKEKPKWELIPFETLMSIIEIPRYIIEKDIDSFDLLNFNRTEVLNHVLKIISYWRVDNPIYRGILGIHDLSLASFGILYLIRGKSYTEEEINASDEKFRWDLFDLQDIDAIANIYTMGARKYAPNNWKLVDPERYFGALMRHLITVNTVHKYDSELGCMHLHQAVWNMMSIIWLENDFDKEELTE